MTGVDRVPIILRMTENRRPPGRPRQFNGVIRCRVFKGYRERVFAAAARAERTPSEWLRGVLRDALRASEAEAANSPAPGQETN